jgi:hypothetical protein
MRRGIAASPFAGDSPRVKHCALPRIAKTTVLSLAWLVAVLFAVWSAAALWFDFPAAPAAGIFAAAVICGAVLLRRPLFALLWTFAASGIVLVWWLQLEPSIARDWQTDVSRLPWAEIEDGEVTIHDVRDFDYPEGTEEVPRWTTRTVRLDDIEGIDLALNYWGSPWIAHPIVIFRVRGGEPVALSIETRKERGEEYSAVAGFFRQYELIIVAGTERDLLGVRAMHREGEDVYLFGLTATPEDARARFMEYVRTMNTLRERPRWYNALTSNCTTAIRSMNEGEKMPFDWRLIANGKGDEMLYERGLVRTDGLSLSEWKARAHANDAIRAAYYDTDDFAAAIRRGRPGFQPPASGRNR